MHEPTETIQIEILRVINAFESPRQTLLASIVDDDPAPASVTLAWSNTTVSEAGGASYLTASLAQPSSLPVTIEFAFAGTATLNADYARSALPRIVIPAGQLSASLWMLARNDEFFEGPETVSAVVSRIINGIIVGPSEYELVIVDDESTLALSRSQSDSPARGINGVSFVQSSTSLAHETTSELMSQRQTKIRDYPNPAEGGELPVLPSGKNISENRTRAAVLSNRVSKKLHTLRDLVFGELFRRRCSSVLLDPITRSLDNRTLHSGIRNLADQIG